MSHARAAEQSSALEKRYKGVRRRRWGKWVSEIRVPGTGDRLWLGSYASAEAAAVAHDTAVFFLWGPTSAAAAGRLNFPDRAAALTWACLSPLAVQRAASDRGMAADAQLVAGGGWPEDGRRGGDAGGEVSVGDEAFNFGGLSVEEMEMMWM